MSIDTLIEKADKQMDYSAFKKAQKLYEQASEALAEPKEEQEQYLEIMAAIADCLSSQGKNGDAMKHLERVMIHPTAAENAYLHLRYGQIAFEVDKMELAERELKRALELGGKELFHGEYEDYYRCATGTLDQE